MTIVTIDFKAQTTILTDSTPDKLKGIFGYDWFNTKVWRISEEE